MIRRYAKKVDATQKAIVEALRAIGVKVWIISEPCDLLTLYRNRWLPIECKPVKRKRNDQEKQTEFLTDTGTPVCRTPMAAIAAVMEHAK
jgi:hypothetical protein